MKNEKSQSSPRKSFDSMSNLGTDTCNKSGSPSNKNNSCNPPPQKIKTNKIIYQSTNK